MKSLPYRIETTQDKFTSRAGLTVLGKVLEHLGLDAVVDRYFPKPGSNRGYAASVYIETFIVMLNEGGRCLDDVRHLHQERSLLALLGLSKIPSADALGDWLRRYRKTGLVPLREVNRAVLQRTLGSCRKVTLDIDATFVEAHKKNCKWTYLNKRGYMPMVGHIAETGQVVATELRKGNKPPSKDNLGFIQICEAALPKGVTLKRCRIDAAGYQRKVIEYLERKQIGYAIRAKMCNEIRYLIADANHRGLWRPLMNRKGEASQHESVYRTLHVMNDMEQAFELVIQRRPKQEDEADGQSDERGPVQLELPLGLGFQDDHASCDQYIYRAIATNLSELSASEIVHFYNARGEHSENRIKEMKLDFAARYLPCGNFKANKLYFAIAALAYNVYVLLRLVLPPEFETARVSTVRLRLYDLAGKIVSHARQTTLKLNEWQRQHLEAALSSIEQLLPEPVS